ncbi:MAG: putative holin-like toxin [Treponema sp.]|nr:putative holin-like toxin [Treponema sp.]
MTGYESIMLLCAIGTFVFTIASFVLEILKALDKKR